MKTRKLDPFASLENIAKKKQRISRQQQDTKTLHEFNKIRDQKQKTNSKKSTY